MDKRNISQNRLSGRFRERARGGERVDAGNAKSLDFYILNSVHVVIIF